MTYEINNQGNIVRIKSEHTCEHSGITFPTKDKLSFLEKWAEDACKLADDLEKIIATPGSSFERFKIDMISAAKKYRESK